MRPLALLLLLTTCGFGIVSGVTTTIDPTYCHLPLSNQVTKTVDVLVIGAGMAGVSAAHTLYDYGLTNAEGVKSFKVIEGQKHIGGRVKHDAFQGFTVEVGANWLVGGQGSPTFELAWRYGLKYDKQLWWDIQTYRANGTRVQNQAVPWGEFARAYECLSMQGDQCQTPPYLDSPNCIRSARDVLKEVCSWDVEVGDVALKQIVEYFDMDYEFAQDPTKTNLQFEFPVWPYYDFQDVDNFVDDPRGYNYIINQYAKEIDPSLNHYFEKGREVCLIDWNDVSDGYATVHTQNSTTRITYMTRKIIWTPSHGVLQQNSSTIFSPAVYITANGMLPQEATGVAKPDVYTMAIYIKLFVRFSKKFWGDSQFIQIAVEKDGWCNHWQVLHTKWKNEFLYGSRMLMCTITTEAWAEIQASCGTNPNLNGLDDPTCVRQLIAPLEEIYPNFVDPYPIPPDNGKTDWYYYTGFHERNPWTYGSYTNSKVNFNSSALEKLNEPLSNVTGYNVTHFGGSASCRRHANFVPGAYYAGKRAAEQVVKELGLGEPVGIWEGPCDKEPSVGLGVRYHKSRGSGAK